MIRHERLVALAILRRLAKHQLELVHQHEYTDRAHHAILETVAEYTPGISARTRAEQWSTFVATFEVLLDLDHGFTSTAAVLAAAGSEDGNPLDSREWVRVRDNAVEEQAGALDLLLGGRLHAVSA